MGRLRDGSPKLGQETRHSKLALSNASLAWAGVGIGGVLLAYLLIGGQLPLPLAAGASLGAAGVIVLATMSSRPKLLFVFFLNACLLVVAQREVVGMDLAGLLSLLTALLAAFGFVSTGRTWDVTPTSTRGSRYFGTVQYLIIGFTTVSIISTLANSQNLLSLLPWINGAIVALVISWAPFSQLPSFASARRAVLIGGAVTAVYDLYLLATGKAVSVDTFNAGRFSGSLGDYELLAEFYGAVILLCLTAIFFDTSRMWRTVSGFLLVLSFVILLATQSRGPIVVLCLLTPVLILISAFRFRESAGKILMLVFVGALALGASVGALSATPLFARFSSVQLGGSLESILNRASVWEYFTQLPKFVDSGLTGNGFDYPYEEIGTYPHSLYLWLLWSGGVISLIFFGLMISLLLWNLARGISLRHSASLSAAAMFVYILLDEVKIEAARTAPTVCFLWVVLSLAILASREQREL